MGEDHLPEKYGKSSGKSERVVMITFVREKNQKSHIGSLGGKAVLG